MGLFDRLKGKVAASDKPQAEEERRAAGKPDRVPIGGHWGILCDTQDEVMKVGMDAAQRGMKVRAAPLDGRNAAGIMTLEDLLSIVCIVEDTGRILTFYPKADGIAHQAMFAGAIADKACFEGMVVIKLGPAEFTVFDPMYFYHHGSYKPGQSYRFALAGIAYGISRAGGDKFTDRDGRELNMKGMAAFMPKANRPSDDYSFRSPVKAIEPFQANGKPLLRLTTTLFRHEGAGDGFADVDIYLYVRQDRLNGYEPAVGDDIEGAMWLQGCLAPPQS